jgi:N-acetylmuramoyl-L-alanine amidase
MAFKLKHFFTEDDPTREYWDSGDGAAGCIFIAKDTGRILIAHRSDRVDFEPHTWGTWGGKVDAGESPKQAVEREVEEETGFSGRYKISHLWTYNDESAGFQYHNYLVVVPHEFTPQLNWENDDSEWVEFGHWPDPLHFGLVELLKHAGETIKKIVLTIKKKNAELLEAADAPPAHIHQVSATKPSNVLDRQAINDAYIVAATIWAEARGEGTRGMQAVLNVIMNRAKGDFSKAKEICLNPSQFSVWNNIDNKEEYALKLANQQREDETYRSAIALVDKAMHRNLSDITGGAIFYFNPKKANPSWAKKMVRTVRIGNHDFYKLPKKKKKPMQESAEVSVEKQGLIDDGIYGYQMSNDYSWMRYGYEPSRRVFYLYSIATPNADDQNKGHAKALLESFFQLIKRYGGALDAGSYTASGMAYIKHVVERFSKQYGVRLVKGSND